MTAVDGSGDASRRERGEPPRTRVVDSQDLFRGDVEIVILHHGLKYRLRRTKQGKLILYK